MRRSSYNFRLLAVLGATLILGALAGCSSATDSTSTTTTPSSSALYVSYSGTASTTSTNNWGGSNAYI
jgi:hypothetical protein